ncbi:MAG: hypothetical protein M1833_005424 [Piccolia ochrophora]|nr:MAG: hypothetical protein M1833_005424 [Piccolia ochrophora]
MPDWVDGVKISLPLLVEDMTATGRQVPFGTMQTIVNGIRRRLALTERCWLQLEENVFLTTSFQRLRHQSDYEQDEQGDALLAQYDGNVMYRLSPQQVPQGQSYQAVRQYQQRGDASMAEIHSAADVPQMYMAGEPTNPLTAEGPSRHPLSHSPSALYSQQAPADRTSFAHSFFTGMSDSLHGGAPQGREGPESVPNLDAAFNNYTSTVVRTFERSRNGQLVEVGQSLLEMSEWLLSHTDELGLTGDEPDLHSDRLELWRNFNYCWLTALQKQKGMTRAMLTSGHPPRPPQCLIPERFLRTMGTELVRLCDKIERHGLVDYEMGVWEEEIIAALEECLDLLEPSRNTTVPSSSSQRASSARLAPV